MKTGHIICGIALVALMNCVSFVLGQEQGGFAGNKVTNLTKSDLVGVPNKQVIANIYEVPAGAMVPRHFHHGDEFHLVLAGEWAAEVEGRPIKNLKTGVKFGRKPKLTPHQQQEALKRRARGDALGLTSPDPMQSHTQLSHVSRNKVGQTAIYLRQSGPFTTTGRPHHGYGKKSRSFCQLILGNNQSLSSSFPTSVSIRAATLWELRSVL